MADENESTPMQVDAPPPGDEPISKAGHIAWRTVNVIAAILAIFVLKPMRARLTGAAAPAPSPALAGTGQT